MIKNDLLHLKNMVDAVDAIDEHKASGAPPETLQEAVAFQVIIIGEAASQLSAALKSRHPQIPWRQIVDTRNRFIHGYYDIDYAILWNVVSDHLPNLKSALQSIIHSLES